MFMLLCGAALMLAYATPGVAALANSRPKGEVPNWRALVFVLLYFVPRARLDASALPKFVRDTGNTGKIKKALLELTGFDVSKLTSQTDEESDEEPAEVTPEPETASTPVAVITSLPPRHPAVYDLPTDPRGLPVVTDTDTWRPPHPHPQVVTPGWPEPSRDAHRPVRRPGPGRTDGNTVRR